MARFHHELYPGIFLILAMTRSIPLPNVFGMTHEERTPGRSGAWGWFRSPSRVVESRSARDEATLRLAGAILLSAGVSLAILLSSSTMESRLGAPSWWPWLLTGLQVLALWAAGARHRWGWLLGAAVQPPWIAYAVLTGQLGFIPGCAVSSVVQTVSFLRTRKGHFGITDSPTAPSSLGNYTPHGLSVAVHPE